MMRHSYQVQLRHELIRKTRLEIDLFNNPDNDKAKELLKETIKSIEWYEKQIRDGKDPGVHIL